MVKKIYKFGETMKKRIEANPFRKIPTILYADELLDKAHNRAEKVASELRKTTRGESLYKSRIIEEQKIRATTAVISDYLSTVVKKTPSVDNLDPFYREILEILIDTDDFKKSLGALNWASDFSKKLGSMYGRRVHKAGSARHTSIIRKQFNGRISSVVKQIYPNLACIAVAREKLKNLPTVKDMPTVVIAGYPNVGKSTLLRKLTDAEPEINAYPFTTKGLNVGYSDYGIQFVDTPGVLDRPIYERNDIELHAVVALNYLADLIVFVIDPTEYCGYTINEQINLTNEIEKTFKVPIVIIINKIDIEGYEENLKIAEKELGSKFDIIHASTENNINIDIIKKEIMNKIDL